MTPEEVAAYREVAARIDRIFGLYFAVIGGIGAPQTAVPADVCVSVLTALRNSAAVTMDLSRAVKAEEASAKHPGTAG